MLQRFHIESTPTERPAWDVLRGLARRATGYELVWLALAAPALLFVGWWTWAGLAVIALTWLLRRVATGQLTRRTAVDGPIAVLVLAALIGAAVSVRPEWSWPRVAGLALGVAIFYGLVNRVGTEEHLRRLATGLVLAGLGYAVVGLLGTDWGRVRLLSLPQVYALLPALLRGLAPSAMGGGDLLNPRQVAGAVIVLWPAPMALLLFGRQRGLRLLSGLAVLVMGAALLLSQSLPGVAAGAVALAFLAVWRRRLVAPVLGLALAALVVGLAAYGYGPQRAAALLSLDDPLGIALALRLDMWSRALAMLRDMPLTGIGLNTFPLIQYQFYPGFLLGPEPHAHNLFLQTALDLGLPGLLAFLAVLAACARALHKAYDAAADRDVRALLLGLAGSVLAYLTYGLLDTTPWGSRAQLALWAVLGAGAAAGAVLCRASDRPAATSRPVWPVLLGVLAVAGLAALWSGLWDANRATVQAQGALLQARQSAGPDRAALLSARAALQRATARPAGPHLYALLAETQAWLGEDEEAVAAWRQAVALESADPLARYLPSEGLRRLMQGESGHERWDDLLRVYAQWTGRFPDRAGTYVQTAIVRREYQHDAAGATAVARAGLERGAAPQGPLRYYLSLVGQGQ